MNVEAVILCRFFLSVIDIGTPIPPEHAGKPRFFPPSPGKSNKEIAAQIGIRADSVEDIANTPYTKLGVPIRAEAVDVAHRKHLLKP